MNCRNCKEISRKGFMDSDQTKKRLKLEGSRVEHSTIPHTCELFVLCSNYRKIY